jgi:ABC-type proline/glycine betaine transport system substrate-binding protein
MQAILVYIYSPAFFMNKFNLTYLYQPTCTSISKKGNNDE